MPFPVSYLCFSTSPVAAVSGVIVCFWKRSKPFADRGDGGDEENMWTLLTACAPIDEVPHTADVCFFEGFERVAEVDFPGVVDYHLHVYWLVGVFLGCQTERRIAGIYLQEFGLAELISQPMPSGPSMIWGLFRS